MESKVSVPYLHQPFATSYSEKADSTTFTHNDCSMLHLDILRPLQEGTNGGCWWSDEAYCPALPKYVYIIYMYIKGKSKVTPLQARLWPRGE